MKKITFLLVLFCIIAIAGCASTNGSKNESANVTNELDTKEIQEKAKIEKEHEQLKKEATKADFIEINGHYDEVKSKKVFVQGEVSFVNNEFSQVDTTVYGWPNFTVTTKEGDGYGMYRIINASGNYNLHDGEDVIVYGKVIEPDPLGFPTIMGSIVEPAN